MVHLLFYFFLKIVYQKMSQPFNTSPHSVPWITFERFLIAKSNYRFHMFFFLIEECNYTDPRIKDAIRFLMKVPEHTWGLPSVRDDVNWTNTALNEAKQGIKYVIFNFVNE